MSIVTIAGAPKSGKSVVANALRNYYVNQGRGVLLIDAPQQADAASADLLAKILLRDLPAAPTPAKEMPWKPDPVVILVGDQAKRMADFEAIAPGFAALVGAKRFTVTTGIADRATAAAGT